MPTSASGLQFEDTTVGSGPEARAGDEVSIMAAMQRMRGNLARIVAQVRDSSDSN